MLDRSAVARTLRDRLSAEIVALRGIDPSRLPRGPWPDTMPIAEALGADSLDRMALAGAINEMFHVHDTGVEDMLLARRQFGDWVDLGLHASQSAAARITFRSSGSTGLPKRCTHGLAALAEEAAEHLARLRPGRIFSAVPAHHIYGFIFTALLPSLAGCQVIDLRENLPPRTAFHTGDVIVSFPDHWRFLARSYPSLPAITGITSAAPMPAELARAIAAQGVRLVEIYGSSETAGIGWRDDPDAPFLLFDRWRADGVPAGSGVVTLLDRNGVAAALQDELVMAADRAFHLRGRVDGAVQVGGINVYPSRIAALLQSHDRIAEAQVALTAPDQGSRLSAVLVPSDQATDLVALRAEMESWITTHLSPPEQPRHLTFATDLPKPAATWKTVPKP